MNFQHCLTQHVLEKLILTDSYGCINSRITLFNIIFFFWLNVFKYAYLAFFVTPLINYLILMLFLYMCEFSYKFIYYKEF